VKLISKIPKTRKKPRYNRTAWDPVVVMNFDHSNDSR